MQVIKWKPGETTRLYHKQISEKMKRLEYPKDSIVAEYDTLSEHPAISKNLPVHETSNVAIASMHREQVLYWVQDQENVATQVAPAIKPAANRKNWSPFRKASMQQPEVARDHLNTLILKVKRSNLSTKELVQQELVRFWQQTGFYPDVICLSSRRYYWEVDSHCRLDDDTLIPYDVGEDDICLKKYFSR